MSRRDGTTTKVFVGSLPGSVTPEDLRGLFEPYGKIVECDIANRCGFLHLEDKELAEKAIADLNNTNFFGGRISVEKGRVKPPKSRRRENDDTRGRRDRGGPYSRDDDYGRGPRNGMGGGYGGAERDYEYDRYGGYDRGAPPARGYGADYASFPDRRPMYDDRSRDYMDDRRGYASNGYGRSYDDHMNYPESRGGYDDRRMAPFSDVMDDRRPAAADHRSALDSAGTRSMGGYDRGAPSNDMYSRRGDPPSKSMGGYGDRNTSYGNYGSAPGGDSYGSNAGYGGTSSSGYGTTSNTGGYGSGGNYGSGYDGASAGGMQNMSQSSGGGGYATGGGGYGSGGGTYSSGGTGYGTGSGTYGSGGGGYSSGNDAYGSGSATGGSYGGATGSASYGSAGGQGGYGDSYGASRGSYDDSYSMQSRGLSSGAGVRERDPRRGISSGAERRY